MRSRAWCASLLFLLSCGREEVSAPRPEQSEALMMKEGPPLFSEPPRPQEGVKRDPILEVIDAKSTEERAEVQEKLVDDQLERADEVNDDLEDLIIELRRRKGLPKAPVYRAPSEAAAELALEEHLEKGREPRSSSR